MLTILEIIKRTTEFLAGKGIEAPRLNAELLIAHALELQRMQLYLQFERPLSDLELDRIRPLVRRRGQREPLQYIVGEADFFGIRLKVDQRALIPRPETELLVEKIVAARQDTPPSSVLDLGTGTGAIALAIATAFPSATVVAVDISDPALSLARENAASAGVESRVRFVCSDWFDGIPPDSRFDVIAANPPYLSAEETVNTEPEVRNFEPAVALTSHGGGLAHLREILSGAPRFLTPGGLLAVETGIAQHGELTELARSAGFTRVESARDLAGRDRFLFAWRG